MLRLFLLTGICLSIIMGFYNLFRNSKQIQHPVSVEKLERDIENISRSLNTYLNQENDSLKRLSDEQTIITEKLTDFKFELENVRGQIKNLQYQASNEGYEHLKSELIEPELSNHEELKNPSERQVGEYLEERLAGEEWDAHLTESVKLETQTVFQNIPNTQVNELDCASQFCRAQISGLDGKQPDIDNIWGNPPFMHEGFTIPKSDGSLVLYFTNENTPLEELKKLAFNRE